MYGYQQQYRPVYAYPAMAQGPAAAPAPAPSPAAALTPGQRTGAIVIGSAETAFGIAASWIGVRAGLKDKGVFSVLGWVVAAGGAVFTVINLAGTIGVIRS